MSPPSLGKRSLSDGSQGVTHKLPVGDVVVVDDSDYIIQHTNGSVGSDTLLPSSSDEAGGLTIHDAPGRLQWSIKFFENLHMDLRHESKEHLVTGMERLSRTMFEEQYVMSHGVTTSMKILPKTQEDPTWSPIVEIQEVQVPTSTTIATSTSTTNLNMSQETNSLCNSLRLTKSGSGGSSSNGGNGSPKKKAAKRERRNSWSTSFASGAAAAAKKNNTSIPTSTKAMVVIHRLAYQLGEEVVMGRFLLPVRRGLYEVIVIAADDGRSHMSHHLDAASTSSSPSPSPRPTTTKTTIGRSSLHLSITSADEDDEDDDDADGIDSQSENWQPVKSAVSLASVRRSPEMDGADLDVCFPGHCLTRVRKAMRWLLDESDIVVSDPPLPVLASRNAEVDLPHLHCRFTSPARFLPCPNPENLESNKYRFCRATLGGTGGVEMMVVSCWYGADVPKGNMRQLKKVAIHASKIIHESQQLFHIKITAKEVALGKHRPQQTHHRWLSVPGVAHPKDAVVTIVDCMDAQGQRKQNTIGWVREATSGNVYLVYFVDTLRSDATEVQRELLTTLASIRVPRVISNAVRRKLAWHATATPALSATPLESS